MMTLLAFEAIRKEAQMASVLTAKPLNEKSIERRISALGPWFHNICLGGIQTAPEHFLGDYPRVKFESFREAIPLDLTGKTVLDIGCNAGFYSFEMKRRGAARARDRCGRTLSSPGSLCC